MQIFKLVVGAALAVFMTTTSVQAVNAPVVPISDQVEVKEHTVELTIQQKIDHYANIYNVKPSLMRSVVKCESGFNPNAVGDQGHSRGLVQIYDNYHPTISHEQAFNPDFALDFLARNISQGKGSLWSCYRFLE